MRTGVVKMIEQVLNQLAWRVDSRLHPVPVATESYERDTWIPLVHEIRENGIPVA